MDKNCYVEPIYKNSVSVDQIRKADKVMLAVWGNGL